MPKPQRFPPISTELMNKLEEMWPDVMPDLASTQSLADLRVKQGELLVVRFLRRQFDIQNKTILEGR